MILSPILMLLRKPWKGHSRYSAIATVSNATDRLREGQGACWWLLSTKVDEGRRTFVDNLRLRFVNFRSGGRARYKGTKLSELLGVLLGGGRSHGRRWAWLSSLYRSWVLVACITGVLSIIAVRDIVGIAINLCIYVLMPAFPCRRFVLQRYIS